jgi:MFS family permease
MLDLTLFRSRRFSSGSSAGSDGSYLVLFGVLLLVPFYLSRGLGFGAARAGLELMALPVALGLVAPLAGKISDRIGARRLTVSGMGIAAIGLLAVGLLAPGTPGLLLLLALIGGGLDLFTAPNNATIMGSVPPQQAGMASGVLNMSRGIGTALGLALTGLLFAVNGNVGGGAGGAGHAFTVTALVLAGIAAGAGVVSGLRPPAGFVKPARPDLDCER